MKLSRFAGMALGVVVAGIPCPAAPADTDAPPAHIDVPTSGVTSIALPTVATPMPSGPGQPMFLSSCLLCHSARYVLMQPAFPKKVWTAEVDKMRKVFGAPISDEQVEPLVTYLMQVRGNGK